MRVRIVISYAPRYRRGHSIDFVPPVTGIHLAALSAGHEVELYHEQVRRAPVDGNTDCVAISFFSGFARSAYALADRYRALGIPVIGGGPHVTYWPDEALEHFDAIAIGEAESVWQQMLSDAATRRLKKIYRGTPAQLAGLPTPRYDLLEPNFVVRRVLQATRGCPFSCSFCTVPNFNPGFRVRPVDEVVRDIATTHFSLPWQDKVVWFWDDNLLVKREWAKNLLRELAGLNKWWLTQASIDIVKDRELLDLMERSGCIGIFLGIESLDDGDLRSVRKRQNKTAEYRDAIERLHARGICVMAGFISGFDDQTPETIVATADRLNAVGIDVPFLSILTPFRGTPLYDEHIAAGRILADRDWPHYNGYNVAFRPARMTPEQLLAAHRTMWKRAFGPASVAHRIARAARGLSPGGTMLATAMNAFYGLKRLSGNLPVAHTPGGEQRIDHPAPMLSAMASQ